MVAALSWAARLKAGLARTRDVLNTPVEELFTRKRVDEALYEELETALLQADCGVAATQALLAAVRKKKPEDGAALKAALRDAVAGLLAPLQKALDTSGAKPFVIMVAGVNGAGKTTSIGKLAHWLLLQKKSVLLAAGDTFRAAAREQLVAWGERNNVPVIAQASGDPGAVVFDALQSARSQKMDVLLADTAGRLHAQTHLMEELKKVKRVVQRVDPTAPHEVLLVLDANQGQNALSQAVQFNEAVGVTGLVLTKLDGTAKGGIVVAIARKLGLPIRFIGIGEQPEDFGEFDAQAFAQALVQGPREPAGEPLSDATGG